MPKKKTITISQEEYDSLQSTVTIPLKEYEALKESTATVELLELQLKRLKGRLEAEEDTDEQDYKTILNSFANWHNNTKSAQMNTLPNPHGLYGGELESPF